MPMKAAARRPALESFISLVNLDRGEVRNWFMQRVILHEHVRCPCSKGTERGGQEDTDIANVNREVYCSKDIPDGAAGGHETGVDGATYDTS